MLPYGSSIHLHTCLYRWEVVRTNKESIPDSWLYCRSIDEWHDWLTLHHAAQTEVWLQIRKAGSTGDGVGLGEAVEEAICFGWIDGKLHSLDSDRFTLRFTPRKPGSLWSVINRNRAEALIADGRMTEAGMVTIRQAQENGRWQAAYTSREAPDIPAHLQAALQADQAANENFESWSNSRKLQAVAWVGQSKRLETRTDRIKKVVSCAHNNEKLF